MENLVYTVGHSVHEIDFFRELLEVHSIDCIVDVRSIPASAHTPQFNKDVLRNYLANYNIRYLHFGEEFGARRIDYDCLDDGGQVDFPKVCKTAKFLSGIKRLQNGLNKGFHISLMCSEANPIGCHRFALISRYLSENGFEVKHILKDNTLITQADAEKEMINEYIKKGLVPEPLPIFDNFTNTERREIAFKEKNKEIGYINKTEQETIMEEYL